MIAIPIVSNKMKTYRTSGCEPKVIRLNITEWVILLVKNNNEAPL